VPASGIGESPFSTVCTAPDASDSSFRADEFGGQNPDLYGSLTSRLRCLHSANFGDCTGVGLR